MKKIIYTLLTSTFLWFPASLSAENGKLEATSNALITFQNPHGWSSGLRLQRGTREFQAKDDLVDVDTSHILFRMGAAPLPFLNIWAEAGTSKAEHNNEDGENGLQWGFGGYARLLEWPIEESPVVGLQKSVALGIELAYTDAESNFDEKNFNWQEWRISPLASYTHNRKGDYRWFFYEPDAIAIRGGPVFISTDGEYGDASLEENRNFGAQARFDLLWANGWVTSIDALLLGSEERELGLNITKNF